MHAATLEPAQRGLSDAEVAQRIAAGDREELRRLMRRCNQTLYRTARSILKDDAEAEDAVQEGYLLAFRSMGSFRGDAKLSTWLVRIVANEAIGRTRKRNRRAEVISLTERPEHVAQRPHGDVGDTASNGPEHQAMRGEIRRLLEAKIDQLPDAFRTVFVLRAVEEMTVEETASVLAIPEATVRTRYFRAKGLLRAALSPDTDGAFAEAFGFAGARCDRIVAGVIAQLA